MERREKGQGAFVTGTFGADKHIDRILTSFSEC